MEQAPTRSTGLFCRFYIDRSWRLNSPHIPILYPFWGNPLTDKTPYQKELFSHQSFDTSYYSITENLEEADAILLPYRLDVCLKENPKLIDHVQALSLRVHKPLLVDGTGDIERPIKDSPRMLVLRYGGYRFSKKPNELTIPLYADDLLERFCEGKVSLRTKQTPPIVGFAGWTSIPVVSYVKAIIKESPNWIWGLFDQRLDARKKGIFFRKKALDALRHSELVAVNLLERESYSGHTTTVIGDPKALRLEFVKNLVESDYGLDVRGDANNSIRLGEILSLGRIPIVIDTERNLPFIDTLDYSTFSLIVDFKDIEKLGELVSTFHNGVSDEAFMDMQKKAREVYATYFTVNSLMPRILERLFRA